MSSNGTRDRIGGPHPAERWLKARVDPGMFTSERAVTVQPRPGVSYFLFVDETDVDEDAQTLRVWLIDRGDEESVVLLPRETSTSGRRWC